VKAIPDAATRVKSPTIKAIPPKNSEAAAQKPQKAGAKSIPTFFIAPPIIAHFSGPSMIFG